MHVHLWYYSIQIAKFKIHQQRQKYCTKFSARQGYPLYSSCLQNDYRAITIVYILSPSLLLLSLSLLFLPLSSPCSHMYIGHDRTGSTLHWCLQRSEQHGASCGTDRWGHVHQLRQVLHDLQRLWLPGYHLWPQDPPPTCDPRLHRMHPVCQRVPDHRLHTDGGQDGRAVHAT